LQSGDFDVIWTSAPEDQIDPIAKAGGFNVYHHSAIGPDSLGLRNTREKLGDIRVRQAIAHAVDNKAIATALFGDNCVPTRMPVPPGTPLYVDGYDPYPYDPDKARSLLAEAGAVGMNLEIVDSGATNAKNEATALQQQLSDVGFNVTLRPGPTGAGGLMADGQFDSYVTGYIQQDHVLQFVDRYFTTGGRFQFAAGEDGELLALMAEARKPGLTDAQVTDLNHQIGEKITDLALIIPICVSQWTVMADPKVLNLENARLWSLYDMRFVAAKAD
jgi:ABC-type transport system substrate-binding protein